jgi:type II secretory ATPase GspE/PulE/Tfp pilus assembly ATPase PilB-like protein
MIALIDSVLPFEACLFHQIIPLSLEGNQLNLGMVNPKDSVAREYVRRQVSYINYAVVPWRIASDWHRQTLSKYLSHTAKVKQRLRQGRPAAIEPVVVAAPLPSVQPPVEDRLTYVVDSPERITLRPVEVPSEQEDQDPPSPKPLPADPPVAAHPPSIPVLDLGSSQFTDNSPDWRQLPAKDLLARVLRRVLAEGIGRLYFERHATTGKIVGSQDGKVENLLGAMDLPLFEAVILELKRLVQLSPRPTNGTQQGEIERIYGQEPLLLRFRFMVNGHGQEAALQILRGSSLKLYQRQRLSDLSRETLSLAKTLQGRVHDLLEATHHSGDANPLPAPTLHTLRHLLQSMQTQVNQLIQQGRP